MKRIQQFSSEIVNRHKACLYDKIVAALKTVSVDDLTDDSRERGRLARYLACVDGFLKRRECLTAKAGELGKMVDEVEQRFFKWCDLEDESPWKVLNDRIAEAFGYESFRDKKGHKGEPWGGEVLMRELLKVARYCPYCNAETVYAIEMESQGKGRPPLIKSAFDHFYPKGRYPFLSVSLYNLIPSCHRCNSQYKIDRYRTLRNVWHPYVHDVDQKMKFVPGCIPASIWEGAEDDEAFTILFLARNPGRTQTLKSRNYEELFQLQRVYSQVYRREAIQSLHAAQTFGEQRLRQLKRWFSEAGLKSVDPEIVAFGTPLDPGRIDMYRCSKLIQDMRAFWCSH